MNPYKRQPPRAFWSRSVSNPPGGIVDPIEEPSFEIMPSTKVATAGSCFAQHIARHLKQLGIVPLVTEPASSVTASLTNTFGYDLYTARYGNIYTSRQMLQLFQRAYGLFTPLEAPWRKDGVWFDPFRPLIPGGFATVREFERDREQHLAAVRTMFESLDVLVFTLGLTEAWISRYDGAVFPSCPGTIAGTWSDDHYAFVNFSVDDIVGDLRALISAVRATNPGAKILLTVSPVPLVATATGAHVLQATIYSKSVLRVCAQTIADAFEGVDYFPSYEIITGPQAGGRFFAADRRTVTEDGVATVMGLFSRHYVTGVETIASPAPQLEDDGTAAASLAMEVVCDEMYNDVGLASGGASASDGGTAIVPASI